jgi:hypothetical protein
VRFPVSVLHSWGQAVSDLNYLFTDVVVVIGFVLVAVLVVGVLSNIFWAVDVLVFLGYGWCFSCVEFATVVAVANELWEQVTAKTDDTTILLCFCFR